MNVLISLFVIIIFLVGLVTWLFYKYISKFLWFVPVAALIVSGCLFFRDISIIKSESTFAGKLELYFHNDWSMGFYLFYLPIVVASVITTGIAYLYKHDISKFVKSTQK